MKRVLVLGGGGVIGVAWEAGLLAGLRQGGVDPSAVDAIVGTSAGAIVGAQLAAGRLAFKSPQSVAQEGSRGLSAVIDPKKFDSQRLGNIFRLWSAMSESTNEQVAVIGKLAREVNREFEATWVTQIEQSIDMTEWPERPLSIAAVETLSGERRMFDRNSGALLSRAVAASSAVPGLFPSVEIAGQLYMDGQVQSSTNADVVLPWKPEQVLIAMPTNSLTARGIGKHAERMLAVEVQQLEAQGCSVRVRTPSAEDAARFGSNLMNPAQAPAAYACGVESGLAWATELA